MSSKLNYKTEAKKAFSYINKLCLKENKLRKEPFELNKKILIHDYQIANAFLNHFSAKQRKWTKMKKEEKNLKRLNTPIAALGIAEIDVCNKVFSDSELKMAIAQLKTRRSPGYVRIFVEFILNMGEELGALS